MIPSPAGPSRVDRLWEHLCFEAFISASGNNSYREFNFSPSGQWAAYAFCGYRQRSPEADPASTPDMTISRFADALELKAVVFCDKTARAGANTTRLIGLSAVVESFDGRLSYWALRHPDGEPGASPDFHDRRNFCIELPPLAEPSSTTSRTGQ